MRILILGSGGMAGHIITTYFEEKGYNVTNMSNKSQVNESTINMDVMGEEFKKYLDINSFDVIINCIGILIQDSEARKDLAVYLNSYLPHFLEQKYLNSNTKIIHMSTDCVFSGENAPYKEDSPYDGQTFYDRSKALGEIKNKKDLTLRMSIIGPDLMADGVGLYNWFMAQEGEIFGYKNVLWTGVTTIELAKGMEAAIQQGLSGLYNFVPVQNISKYELLNLLNDVFRKNISIIPVENIIIDKTLINNRNDFNYKIPDYKEMVKEMRDWIKSHEKLYSHY